MNPRRDLDLIEHVLNKFTYGKREPTVNQIRRAQEAIARLRELLQTQKAGE